MNRWIYLLNITLMSFLGVFGAISLSVGMPAIQGALGVNSTYSQWLSHIYLIALFSSVPISARLAITRGYKFTFFCASALYITSNILICCFDSFIPVLIMRYFAGFAAGLLFPISLTMINETFDKSTLSIAIAIYFAIAFGVGIGLGFLIGGYFTDLFGWNSPFLFAGIVGLPSLLITFFFHRESEKKSLPPFDWIGYFTFIGFLCSLEILINNVKLPWNTEGWHSTFTRTMGAVFIVCFTIFLINELKKKQPLFLLYHFKNRAFAIGSIALFFVGGCLFGTAGSFAEMLESNFHYSKSMTGYTLAPFGFIIGIIAGISGILSRWIHNRYLIITGLTLTILSCFMNHSITHLSSRLDIQTLLLIRAIGIGLTIGPTTALALSKLSPETVARGAMTLTAIRQAGSSYGSDLINLIKAERINFHRSIFGSAMDPFSPKYQEMLAHTQTHLISKGFSPQEATQAAKQLLVDNGVNQADILSTNDAFFILALLLCFALSIFLAAVFLRIIQLKKRQLTR